MKDAIKSKANAAVDSVIDPEKEIDMVIFELEEQKKNALKELLGYKATAKQMEQEIDSLQAKVTRWEQRAAAAVKAGDDETAKKCLREKRLASEELVRVRRDRDEAASYAIELNRSRKQVETKLRILKLKKGTLATQIAAARSGTGNAFGHADDLFEKLARAEEKIDAQAIEAEVSAELDGGEASDAALERELLAAAGEPEAGDDALAALKAKMAKERKQLKE